MDGAYENCLDLLEELSRTLEKLTELAREKADAVRRDDLERLNGCLKREQALSLSLRSMDKRREAALERLGLRGVPLSGLTGRFPPELRPRAAEAAERLRSRFEVYTSAAEVARTTLECNLHQIERYLAEAPPEEPPAMTDIRI